MTGQKHPDDIAVGHPPGGLSGGPDEPDPASLALYDDPRVGDMLRLGVVSTEADALDLIGKCEAAGVNPGVIADVIGRWNSGHAMADMARISEQMQRAVLDIRAARRIQRRGWPKPARAGRRRSRQARSSRPRALRRAIARGLDPELAKREHWAHGGEGHP